MDDQIYEINIKRFIQSAEYQLKKLNECINHLNEFQNYEDWKNVKQANLNASQIIKRIKSDMKEIDKIRSQVVNNLENKSSNKIVQNIDEHLKDIARKLKLQTDRVESILPPYQRVEMKNQSFVLESNYIGPEIYDYQVEKNDFIAQDTDLCAAYDKLQMDCEDLKYLMEAFSNELFKQKGTIDSIESNVLNTQGHIESGSKSLKTALTYKAFGSAAGGAMIGTLVGGPVGFIAGAKLGAVVGVSGGFFGYMLGKYFNKPTE